MDEKLIRLMNTMKAIETKGENTLIMADCIRYLQKLIEETKEGDPCPIQE